MVDLPENTQFLQLSVTNLKCFSTVHNGFIFETIDGIAEVGKMMLLE